MSNLEKNDIKHSITSFDTLIADSTKNKADIGSHYTHSPERHRLYINGTRFQLQYNTTAKFEDAIDSWILKPAANDIIEYVTAERFRYVVGYVIAISQAFQTNQSLQTGDKIVVGYGDPDLSNDMADADGWFIEFVPELDDNDAYITEYRNGTQIDSQRVSGLRSFEEPITSWRRIEQVLNWYNVGNRKVIETFTDGGTQHNPVVQDSSIDGGKGPVTGNQRVVFGVKAGANTDNLELECGSLGVVIKGNVEPIIRAKSYTQTANYGGSGDWEALAAIRIDPNRKLVSTQITNLQIMELENDVDMRLMIINFDPSNTDATGFATPPEHNHDNSVVEVTTNVSEFVDSTGTTTTATADPGGYQLGYASRYTAGTGTANRRESTASRTRKRNIYNGDYALILADSGTTATNVTFEIETEQDW